MADTTVECSKCGALNRLKPAGDSGVPVCGKCRAPLPWLVAADDSTFPGEVDSPIPVLVDFWAEWCGPCRMVTPVVEELAREKAGRIKVVKVDVDRSPATAGQFQIRSIPTLVLFSGGEPVESFVGAVSKHALLQRLAPHLNG